MSKAESQMPNDSYRYDGRSIYMYRELTDWAHYVQMSAFIDSGTYMFVQGYMECEKIEINS